MTEPEEEREEQAEQGTELAVASSVRPRAPTRRPSEDPAGLEEGTTDPANLLAPPTVPIEIPLAAYQRGEQLHYYFNYSDSERDFTYPHNTGTELLSSKTIKRNKTVRLPAWGVMIIAENDKE